MKQKDKLSLQRNSKVLPSIVLIDQTEDDYRMGQESVPDSPHGQQQQVMMIHSETTNTASQRHQIVEVQLHQFGPVNQRELQRQFEQIRFNNMGDCNLMDMDLQIDNQGKKSPLQLPPYQYQKFILERVIQLQMPQLITEGYITSYKLYQIKTRTKHNTELMEPNRLEKKPINSSMKENKVYDTCVSRRFSDFEYLNELLISKYGGFIIPLLPQKNFWTIINLQGRQYAEHRTKSLLQYLNRLFTHKKLKHSEQLKSFLFEEDSKFSTQKGEFLQKNSHLEDKLISIGTGAYEYGKALYNKFVRANGDRTKQEEEIRLNKNKLSKEDLLMSEYEIIVAELMRIMSDMKSLVQETIQQIRTVDDIKSLLSEKLTDTSNVPTTVQPFVPTNSSMDSSQSAKPFASQNLPTSQLEEEFEQISQFISSCHAAIQRRKNLKQQIQSLKQLQQVLSQKYKNSPRSLQLDIVRSKLNKLNKMNETYAEELIKELEFHIDEGKGMLRIFVAKFEKLKRDFFLYPLFQM